MEAKNIILEDLLESASSADDEVMYPLLLERSYIFLNI